MSDPRVIQALKETRAIFDTHEWIPHAPETISCHCLMTALGKGTEKAVPISFAITDWQSVRMGAVELLFDSLPAELHNFSPDLVCCLVNWNDYYAKSLSNVIKLIDLALDKANDPALIGHSYLTE